MFDFEFHNPTKIIFGRDRFACLDQLVPASSKVLLTYGGESARKYGTLDKTRAALKNRTILEFGGIEPNPHFETLMKAVEMVRAEKISFLLAVGGGSVIDGTKFISLFSPYAGDPFSLLVRRSIGTDLADKAIPFGAVSTLPATGSEMNNRGVISHGQGKYPFLSPLSFPLFSLVDPSLTFTLPPAQVANGVVDAFVHTTEQYLTFPVDGRLQDRIAEGILLTLLEIGETTLSEPDNYPARANLCWCATMALNGLTGAGVPQDWATHMIGHELTALFGIDHGQSLAVILPALLEARREKKRDKLLQYAGRVWDIRQGGEDERISASISRTREFFERLGVRTRLSAYGVGAGDIPAIVDNLRAHGRTALSERGDLTLEISRSILESAL